MLRLFFDRSRPLMLSLLVAGSLLLALTLVVGAQSEPTITITPDPGEVDLGASVTFALRYTVPGGGTANPPGVITATWSANASFVEATEGPILVKDNGELRWDYSDNLPLSDKLPAFTLQATDLLDPIVVTATLIVSDTEDLKTALTVTRTLVSVPVTQPEDPVVANVSGSSLVISPTGTVTAGSSIDITVTVSNTGAAPAEDVMVVLTSSLPLQDFALAPLQDVAELISTTMASVSFKLLTPVAPTENRAVRLTAVVVPDAEGDLKIMGLISATGGITQSLANTIAVTPPPRPQLGVQIDGPISIMEGEPLNLSLKLTNTGTAAAENIRFTVRTTPSVQLMASGAEFVIPPSQVDNELVIVLASLGRSETADIQLTGIAPDGLTSLQVDVNVTDTELYDKTSGLADDAQVTILQPQPTAAPLPIATAVQTPTEVTPSPPPSPDPTETPPPIGQDGSGDMKGLLAIGIVALLAALVAGIVLLLLVRGRRKSPPPPETAPAAPVQPEPGTVTTPLPTSGATLESVAKAGLRLRLGVGTTTIGRAPDSTICIDETYMNWETVSRKHAEIRREGDSYVIYDVSKRNGVYVEGRRTARNVLRPGWRIGIGGVEFIFRDVAAEQ